MLPSKELLGNGFGRMGGSEFQFISAQCLMLQRRKLTGNLEPSPVGIAKPDLPGTYLVTLSNECRVAGVICGRAKN
jgi:hypothetical protein